MSVSGLCEICGTGTIEDGCDRCGRLVCIDHYDESTDLCTACLSEFGGSGSDERGRPSEGPYPDGVDEYQF
jgi:hypothetical protein